MRRILTVSLFIVALAAMAGIAQAQAPFTLTDNNSVAYMETDTFMWGWSVDGVSQLYEQDWWIRIGDGPQRRLGELLAPTWMQLSANSLQSTFTGYGITATATYTLLGGVAGSGTADISEMLAINTDGRQPVSVFQYCDFDLGGDADGDMAAHVNANLIRQWDAGWVLDEVVIPTASAWEIGPQSSILWNLQNTPGYDLTNSVSPFGPGDTAYAWQWNATGGSFIISKDKHISKVAIPEPMSMLLGTMGLTSVAGLLRLRRRR